MSYSRFGYPHVTLCRNGKGTSKFIHELVLTAFVGPRPQGMECCHYPDRDPTNNRLENLRWDTSKANEADKKKHGTTAIGARNGQAKLTDSLVAVIKERLRNGEPQRRIARDTGVSQRTISGINRREIWTHVS